MNTVSNLWEAQVDTVIVVHSINLFYLIKYYYGYYDGKQLETNFEIIASFQLFQILKY